VGALVAVVSALLDAPMALNKIQTVAAGAAAQEGRNKFKIRWKRENIRKSQKSGKIVKKSHFGKLAFEQRKIEIQIGKV
jgi:hypothetical protein